MNKDLKKNFEILINSWPKVIEVGDKKIFKNGAARIPRITELHDEIVNKVFDYEKDNELRKMDWAIYTVIHMQARKVDVIVPSEIDIAKVEKVYFENEE